MIRESGNIDENLQRSREKLNALKFVHDEQAQMQLDSDTAAQQTKYLESAEEIAGLAKNLQNNLLLQDIEDVIAKY